MVRIFTDSTSDLSDDLLKKYNIGMIPLHICLDTEEFRDRVEISPDQIYEWADKNNTTPKTSAASYEDIENAFRPVIEAGDEIVMLPISAQMSTTINVMQMVAEDMEAADKISVVDSANLSTGIGLSAIAAAIKAESGASREEIVAYLEEIIPKVRASFVVDTLTYLHRGGRCSAVAAMAGSILKLHPKIVVENGKMDAGKKYRGKLNSVIINYAEDMKEDLLNADPSRVFITHSGCDKNTINTVKEYLEGLNYFEEILITRAGGVISSHCGPGTLGVLFITK